jgi:hypothetical protein
MVMVPVGFEEDDEVLDWLEWLELEVDEEDRDLRCCLEMELVESDWDWDFGWGLYATGLNLPDAEGDTIDDFEEGMNWSATGC